jgi:hypothetical protein
MSTIIPDISRATNVTGLQKALEIFTDDFYAVAIFSGIGLLISLIAIVCGEQGIWF